MQSEIDSLKQQISEIGANEFKTRVAKLEDADNSPQHAQQYIINKNSFFYYRLILCKLR
jgi:hypothetical protein